MKKIYKLQALLHGTFFLLIFTDPFAAIGQNKKNSQKDHMVSIVYGYKTDTKWWREVYDGIPIEAPQQTHDISFRYEFDYKKNIAIGTELLLDDEFKDKSLFIFWEEYSYEAHVVRLLPFIRYDLIETKIMSLYTSLAAGFYFLNFKAVRTYPTTGYGFGGYFDFPQTADEVIKNKNRIGFDWACSAGAKFFFTKNLGLFSEIGFNKTVFQVGLSFKWENKRN